MPEPINLTHSDLPGVIIKRSLRQLPALKAAGWVKAKSPSVKAAAVHNPSPDRDINNPSEEDSK
jgi:hypothetical protein